MSNFVKFNDERRGRVVRTEWLQIGLTNHFEIPL
jgi:hypothetical protein